MMSSEIFAVLADPTRRALLVALSTDERPVGDLVEEVGASQPTVSKHLRILREADLVQQRADGQRRLYRVNPGGLAPIQRWLEQFEHHDQHTTAPDPHATAPDPHTVVLDPHVVAQPDEQPRSRGLLAQVLRRRGRFR